MSKIEYQPIISTGFREIKIEELETIFLLPFGENTQRKWLIDRFKIYLNEFSATGLNVEIWIDGSFATTKPEPEDIDIVFLVRRLDVDYLYGKKEEIFKALVMDRDVVKAKYGVDVFFIDKDDPEELTKWVNTYGYDTQKINEKGIFKLKLSRHV